jgi:glycosyltransferase involved in cell wall biosynthesis
MSYPGIYDGGRRISLVSPPGASASPALADEPEVSVIVPLYNEAGNIPPLISALTESMHRIGSTFEIIAINDGSLDGSLRELEEAAARHPELRIIDFRRNYGQTAAIMAGLDCATGAIIVTIDADLQNDPADIAMLLNKLQEGYDVVSGWRRDRKDAAFRRKLPSRVANSLISWISGVKLHDYGCTLKAYRADVLKGVRLYGEMHRFIPIYASWMGAKVVEMAVSHHPRQIGRSKYGIDRIIKVFLDLIVVTFLHRYFVKPIYVFGTFGIASLLLSIGAFIFMISLKLFSNVSMISTPLPLVTVTAGLVGVMSILMGLLAEMLVRIYFESQGRTAYLVRHRVNFPVER